MEDDSWSFGVSASSRSYQSALKSLSDLCIDFEEIEEDDELKTEYPCPYCSEDYDLLGLCCHIDEEHHLEANYGCDNEYDNALRSWSSLSSSNTGPDPLLSFLSCVPPADSSESVQSSSSTEVTLEEKVSDENVLEKVVHPSPLSDKEHSEKAKRSEFVRGLLLSTIFDGGL
ncbi:Drought-responsive family protein [Corchorus capsularis]|uniref:Drought-responsive family protein n=1 Tax=Corchorus capsularis TaxID=210143 RepID=A0A1R3H0Z5_COCAP|nr:Drought-responsive family protein [Corchorus capsularis]